MTDFPIEAVYANTAADHLASQGAELVEVSSSIANDIVKRAQMLYAVQLRMVAVMQELPSRKKVDRQPVPRKKQR